MSGFAGYNVALPDYRAGRSQGNRMGAPLCCYRCGASLEKLTLPLSQRDACPSCAVHLHVCRMCVHFAPDVPKQCREDDAEEVTDKEKMNFCEWFQPNAEAFDPQRAAEAAKASDELAALFGDGSKSEGAADPTLTEAEKLFK